MMHEQRDLKNHFSFGRMFESALGNLCIVICGMTVLLSAFFIRRAETLPARLIVAAAAALVLIFRW